MISISYKHTNKVLIALCLIVILTIPDILIELFVEGIHFVIEIIAEMTHLAFEGVESVLDHFIEHHFHTEMHETQVIVFYIIMSILAIPTYYIAKILPRIYFAMEKHISEMWLNNRNHAQLYWLGMSINDKIKLGLMIIVSLYFASFFIM